MGTADGRAVCDLAFAVHPHVRGDGSLRYSWAKSACGSPPRAWGRRFLTYLARRCVRFTPTCVGTAHESDDLTYAWTVHPHVRGDGPRDPRRYRAVIGSPPRAWGRRDDSVSNRQRRRFTPTCVGTALGLLRAAVGSRFTPTCVGTAWPRFASTVPPPVHPHVRGDGERALRTSYLDPGSPPRAWGRRDGAIPGQREHRFTPTCVGTAPFASAIPSLCTVHPHVRGDGPPSSGCRSSGRGSPPRAWGRRRQADGGYRSDRFTPTCVGTAAAHGGADRPVTVHPHVRGDGELMRRDFAAQPGSPPRAWGRLDGHGFYFRIFRFTPTCVGTARTRARRCGTRAVHPHVRGDGESSARPWTY